MKKKKNKIEKVPIANTELSPTTIGAINENESGLKSVIIIFSLLIVIIFVLPYVMSWFEKEQTPNPTPQVTVPSQNQEPEQQEEKVENYLSLNEQIKESLNNCNYNVTANEQNLSINITNVNADANILINKPTFIELYTEDKTLIKRIMLPKEMLEKNKSTTYTYDITGQEAYIMLKSPAKEDYPQVNIVSINQNKEPFLTCTKDNETLTYIFQTQNNEYYLTKIVDSLKITSVTEETINNYENIASIYNTIEGVQAQLNQENGLDFTTTLDLNKLNFETASKSLNNEAYYAKDTIAKVINFEMESNDYICN